MRKRMRRCIWVVLLACSAGGFAAQTAAPVKTEAELDLEARQANDLYQKSQILASLPLYEDLHTQRPKNPVDTERLAMAYVAKAGTLELPAEHMAARNHARELMLEAKAQGDNSDLLQVMLEKLGPVESAKPDTLPDQVTAALGVTDPRAPGSAYARAEVQFSKGDLKGAVDLYKQAWEQDPKFYPAALYAGDAEFKLGDCNAAGVWYERAIAIDANYETAHRYWGDRLVKLGKPVEARDQYIEAFLVQPYQKAPRLSVRAWADANYAVFRAKHKDLLRSYVEKYDLHPA